MGVKLTLLALVLGEHGVELLLDMLHEYFDFVFGVVVELLVVGGGAEGGVGVAHRYFNYKIYFSHITLQNYTKNTLLIHEAHNETSCGITLLINGLIFNSINIL